MDRVGDLFHDRNFKLKPRYTTIYHPVRIELGISPEEYCLCDSISKLSNRTGYEWCMESKENLGGFIGASLSTVKRGINKLEAKGLVVRNELGHLRATAKWYEQVEYYKEKTGLN